MKRIPLSIIALLCLSIGSANAQTSSKSNESKPTKVTSEQAVNIVEKAYAFTKEGKVKIELIELDVPELWDRMKGQVFRVEGRDRPLGVEDTSYLIIDKKAYALGNALGGLGLMSLCVADLDKNGEPELIYTNSWGSGLHRSHVTILSKKWKYQPVEFDGAYANANWVVRKKSDTEVELMDGAPKSWDPYRPSKKLETTSNFKIGKLVLKTVKNKPVLDIEFDPSFTKEKQKTILFLRGK